MYKMEGFILSVTVVSLLDFNNMAWAGRQYAAQPSPLNFKPGPAHFILSKFGPGPARGLRGPCRALPAVMSSIGLRLAVL